MNRASPSTSSRAGAKTNAARLVGPNDTARGKMFDATMSDLGQCLRRRFQRHSDTRDSCGDHIEVGVRNDVVADRDRQLDFCAHVDGDSGIHLAARGQSRVNG